MTFLGRRVEGATIPLTGTFRNAAGSLADPTEVVLRIKRSDDSVSVYRYPTPGAGEGAIARSSIGVYQFDYLATVPGKTVVRWEGTGNVAQVDEDYIYIEPSEIV